MLTYLITYILTWLTHSLILNTNRSACKSSVSLPNLITKVESVLNIKIQSAVFMLLHVNTQRWTDKAINWVLHMVMNTQKNKTCFMLKTLLFKVLLFMKQLSKRERTCQNCYDMHAFPNLFYSCLQCELAAEILYTIVTQNFGWCVTMTSCQH
jgi:hypothetical protein